MNHLLTFLTIISTTSALAETKNFDMALSGDFEKNYCLIGGLPYDAFSFGNTNISISQPTDNSGMTMPMSRTLATIDGETEHLTLSSRAF